MIKINLFFVCLMSCLILNAQPTTTPIQQKTYYQDQGAEHYLDLSRRQKTAAWCMLGGGVVLVSAGYMMIINSFLNDNWEFHPGTASAGTIMMYAGTGCVIGSIPMFIASARNKGRSMAASAGLRMEHVTTLVPQGFAIRNYPALSLNITLK